MNTQSERARTLLLVGLSALAVSFGCSAANQEPESPGTEPPPPEEVLGTPPAPESESDGMPEEDEEPIEAADAAPSTASPEDFQAALQVVLQDEALLSQLNLEEPGRFPLRIAGPDIPTTMAVQAHTKSVEVVTTPAEPKDEPVLIFTSITLQGDSGTFKYRYPIEGLRGTSYVSRTDSGWVLESSRISQY